LVLGDRGVEEIGKGGEREEGKRAFSNLNKKTFD
jgi:hypothetical protein